MMSETTASVDFVREFIRQALDSKHVQVRGQWYGTKVDIQKECTAMDGVTILRPVNFLTRIHQGVVLTAWGYIHKSGDRWDTATVTFSIPKGKMWRIRGHMNADGICEFEYPIVLD